METNDFIYHVVQKIIKELEYVCKYIKKMCIKIYISQCTKNYI